MRSGPAEFRPAHAVSAGIAPAPPLKGGSNYFVYHLEGCHREPYGVVNSYDQAPELIRAHLRQMADAGQKRLRIPVFHHRGPDSGTVMDSTGGRLSDGNAENLSRLLKAVAENGFEEVELGFFPLDANDPMNWTTVDESLYAENLSVIRQVRELVVRSGVPYVLDLVNEGAPPPEPEYRALLEYDKRLWADYTRAYGTADTVGFSLTVWSAGRVPQLPEVYGDRPPAVLEVHLYGKPHDGDEYRQFMDTDAAMDRIGYQQPWIIGEVYYNDPEAAAGIRRAMKDADRPVRHLTQWQLSRGAPCDADVAPAAAYDAYAKEGF
ncbi:hypothetical protein ACFYT4_21895 [Streptomyces sp. NPDC004609]|uniref:hypothetical protein n=1 Tax=Streptomyces sp. NPDC004609 TaxID=3364704 RepID=UPI0036BF3333